MASTRRSPGASAKDADVRTARDGKPWASGGYQGRRRDPGDLSAGEWQPYAERYHGPGCAVTPILALPRRLKRVFAIDIEQCPQCGGPLTIVAGILDPIVIATILAHLGYPEHHVKISVEGCAEKVTG